MASRAETAPSDIASTPNTLDRRDFTANAVKIGAGAVATLAAVSAGGLLWANSRGEKQPVVSEGEDNNATSGFNTDPNSSKIVTLEESMATISTLEQSSSLYLDADPHELLGLTYEQIVERGGVEATPANRASTEALVDDTMKALRLFVRAGNTEQDIIDEMKAGIPIGVRGENGLPVTSAYNGPDGHAEVVNPKYGQPLLEGMGPDQFSYTHAVTGETVVRNTTKIKADLLDLKKAAANAFESHASDLDNPTLDTEMELTLTGYEELRVEDGEFSGLKDARRVQIDLQAKYTNASLASDITIIINFIEDTQTKKQVMLFERYIVPEN